MRIRTMLTVAAIGSLTLTGLAASPSSADGEPGDPAEIVTGVLTPEEESAVQTAPGSTEKVDMFYEGRKIDPASDWQGANVCVEVSEDGTMQCFDNDSESNKFLAAHAPTAQARAGARQALAGVEQVRPAVAEQAVSAPSATAKTAAVKGYSSCPGSYVCLWQDANYAGRRLQWPTYSESKTRHLDQYSPSFQDKASSAFVNRPQRGVEVYDFRTGLPDPHLFLGAGYSLYPSFKKIDYTYGGSWNDRADAIKF
ncbi:peptidase inhibitor family I36 protein [Streptomyces sp. NBC_01601]|uniref:peptidase inhibitor family I36 protein n=1 Tax=Streptomyces sp. NBC_01601 TaxID=2975892 RepID=UPI002E2B878E|nr:peptidase inhibitor family I36 protein [Streptomyces sp. NBC_01601]